MLDLTSQGLLAGWKSTPDMSTARQYTSGILLPDSITFLVTGGLSASSSTLSSCERFDIAANKWSSAGNFSLGARYGHASVVFNNVVVVLGGANLNYLNTCEQFNPVSNTWSTFPAFKTARSAFGAAVVLNKIYIAGGYNASSTVISSVEVYNGTSWSPLSPSLAQIRYLCAAVAFQNKLVVLGERSNTEVFDPITSTWNTTFPAMKITPSRTYLAAVSF